jgi:hypothetical protein
MPFVGGGIAAAGLVGGILSSGAQKSAASNALAAQQAAIGQYIQQLNSVGMPPNQSAQIILDQYKSAGTLTPELEQYINSQASAMSSATGNAQAQQTQMQALQRMSQVGQAGMTPQEMAQQRQMQQQVQSNLQGNQQSIIQNMASRGQGGSGAEVAARLGAAQQAANTGSSAADQTAATASQQALQAIGQTGTMAGSIEGQTFAEQAARAQAQDQMNRFNTSNQLAVQQQNTSAQNQAQAANLANAQQIGNANTAGYNQEQYNAMARANQEWQQKLQLAQSYAAPFTALGGAGATAAQNIGNAQSAGYTAATGGITSGLTAYGSLLNNYGSGSGTSAGAGTGSINTGSVNNGGNGGFSAGSGIDPNAGLPTFQ